MSENLLSSLLFTAYMIYGIHQKTEEQRMVENSSSLCLLCDEEPFLLSPTPSPPQASPRICTPLPPSSSPPPLVGSGAAAAVEERDSLLHDLLQREHQYKPCHGYCDQLHQSSYLPAARTRAIRYIISVCSRLNLAIGTAFNAVNYLDRFISMNCTVKWEDWMMELLSIACLSIASKMDEVSIPSLHDLQMEDVVGHSFEASTIQEMELTVLKMLDWRLACITPYSYVEVFKWGLDNVRTTPPSTPIIQLLLSALLDNRFLGFDQSSIAASALRTITITGSEAGFSVLDLSIPALHMGKVNECQKMMDEVLRRTQLDEWLPRYENGRVPLSPNSVISPQTTMSLKLKLHCSGDVPQAEPCWKKQKIEGKER